MNEDEAVVSSESHSWLQEDIKLGLWEIPPKVRRRCLSTKTLHHFLRSAIDSLLLSIFPFDKCEENGFTPTLLPPFFLASNELEEHSLFIGFYQLYL